MGAAAGKMGSKHALQLLCCSRAACMECCGRPCPGLHTGILCGAPPGLSPPAKRLPFCCTVLGPPAGCVLLPHSCLPGGLQSGSMAW